MQTFFSKMKNRKLDNLIKSVFKNKQKEISEGDAELKIRIMNSIPTKFHTRQLFFNNRFAFKFAFGVAFVLLGFLIVRFIFFDLIVQKNRFKPTKVIYLKDPHYVEDKFKPTKTVIITENDRIK